ncbi:hypothetical protein HYV83_03075 [Candidatus Woesearchaeota archaeon]|nr:hypothetical protein [Candidatus Woesearchaeota archaeon]
MAKKGKGKSKKSKSGRSGKSGRKKASARRPARRSVKRTASKRAKAKPKAAKKARARPKAAKKTKAARKPARKAAAKPAPLGSTPLKGQANMIVTFDPNHRGTAELELREVLKQAGEKPQIGQTEVEGLFKIAVSDARKAAAKIRGLCSSNPNLFAVTHHFTPIDQWCQSEVAAMQKAIKAASGGIGNSEKWKMGLNKRHWDKLEGVKLIIKLTDVVERKNVDLDNPQKIVQVEIIGKEAGVALLTPNDIVDVAKEKAE